MLNSLLYTNAPSSMDEQTAQDLWNKPICRSNPEPNPIEPETTPLFPPMEVFLALPERGSLTRDALDPASWIVEMGWRLKAWTQAENAMPLVNALALLSWLTDESDSD